MEISKLKARLQTGDQLRIAKITGYTQTYISLVFCGKRKSQRIMNIAARMIEERELADEQIKKEFQSLKINRNDKIKR